MLTTKLYCGNCGAFMFGESGHGRNGTVYHYYKCRAIKKRYSVCNKKSVVKDWIEDLVVNKTISLIMDDDVIDAIVSMVMRLQEQENVNLPLYGKELSETEKSIENMLNAIQRGILIKSTKERLEKLEKAKEELEVKIACEKLSKPKMSEDFVRFWLLKFRKLDMTQQTHRKMLIDTFVNAVYLYDDKMLLTFNYKEGTEAIAFDEAQKATATAKKKGRSGSDMDWLTPLFNSRCEPGSSGFAAAILFAA